MASNASVKRLLLIGVGHAHLHVLRKWRTEAPPNAQLTCISEFPHATYSGMLPGVLAGFYRWDQFAIDLVELCRAVGAELQIGQVDSLDAGERIVSIVDQPPLPFDVLSINVGSIPKQSPDQQDDVVLPIKPMQTFVQRVTDRLREWNATSMDRPFQLAIVGGGAGGVELAFCLPALVRRELPDASIETTLVHGDKRLRAGSRERTQRLSERLLRGRVIDVRLNCEVSRVENGRFWLTDGDSLRTDLAVWVTGASPPPLLSRLTLPLDTRGFLQTDATLRTPTGDPIFAVGDCGSIVGRDLPKAGVYAVRQGPVLWENLQRCLCDRSDLTSFEPQADFLKLLNTGDGRAILEYRGFTCHARWCWWLKDWIDRRFVVRHRA